MTHKIVDLFYDTYCTLYIGWDPNKDPTLPVGPNRGYRQFPPALQEMLTYCAKQARAPVALYKSLESLSKRAVLFKRGMLGPGPGTDKLARAIMETKTALDKIVMDLLNRLSTLSISLDVTINILDKEKHDVILGRSRNHLDSIMVPEATTQPGPHSHNEDNRI